MGRKDKKIVSAVETPQPPPPPPTTTSSATTTSSSSTSSPQNPAVYPSSSDDVSSDSPPPPPPPTSLPSPVKPRSKPTAAAAATGTTTLGLPALSAKRPAEGNNNSASSKRAKSGPGAATTTDTPQKVLFQRLWSDEDEIVILKGMIDYKSEKGSDPMSNVDDFLEFIKKSLHVPDANRAQIVSKVRRLKNRFLNAKKAENEKKKKKISDPHELQVFELSKRIWLGPELGSPVEVEKKRVDNGVVEVAEKANWVELGLELGFSRDDGLVLREGLKMMGGGERGEVKRALEKANVAYLESYLLKLKVLEISAKKLLEGIRDDQC